MQICLRLFSIAQQSTLVSSGINITIRTWLKLWLGRATHVNPDDHDTKMQPCYCGNPCWLPELTSWMHIFFSGSEDVWSQVHWVYGSNECSLRCFSWLPVYKRTGLTLMTHPNQPVCFPRRGVLLVTLEDIFTTLISHWFYFNQRICTYWNPLQLLGIGALHIYLP